MTNKYNHQGHNSLIAAIISWMLLFCSCEIAWAKNECKKPVEKVVSCNEYSYAAHQGESKDNIEYKGWDGLELTSEGLTLKTKHDKDNVSGIKIATSNGTAVVSNTSIFVWLLHCFALRFIYQSKKINGRWKRLFVLGLTISLIACGGGGGQSAWQC